MPTKTSSAFVFALACLLASPLDAADGDLDTSFSGDGKLVIDWGTDSSAFSAAILLEHGLMLLAGSVGNDVGVVRLTRTGAFNVDFGNMGRQRFSFAGLQANVLAVGTDALDRVIIAFTVNTANNGAVPGLARLTSTGSLDGTFGFGGLLTHASGPPAWGDLLYTSEAEILSDGTAVFAGHCELCTDGNMSSGMFALRVLPTGFADMGFGESGWAAQDPIPNSSFEEIAGVAVDPVSKAVVVVGNGVGTGAGTRQVWALRFTTTGSADTTFAGDGSLVFLVFDEYEMTTVAIHPDNSEVFLGLDPAAVMRVRADGTNDFNWAGGNAFADLDLEEGCEVNDIEVRNDGRLVVVGTIDANGAQTGGFYLARLLANGLRDNSFDGNGVVRYEFDRVANGYDAANGVLLSGGRPVAFGHANANFGPFTSSAMLRLQSDWMFSDGFERGTSGAWLPAP